MARIGLNKNINIGRVVAKVAGTILALYVGGVILEVIGDVMNCTSSPFYEGLTLLGWTVTDNLVVNSTSVCDTDVWGLSAGTYDNVITSTTGSGILAVIGLVGIGSIVLEFVNFKM